MREQVIRELLKTKRLLISLDQERARLAIQIRTYEGLLVQNGGSITDKELEKAVAKSDPVKPPNVSKPWKEILRSLSNQAKFNSTDVMLKSNELHSLKKIPKLLNPSNVRSQLSLYTKRGILVRTGKNKYRIPSMTKDTLKLQISSNSSAKSSHSSSAIGA